MTLPVIAAGKSLLVTFVVVDAPSAYNVIMGRDGIHRMDGEASTMCQVMRCLTDDGLGTIDIKGVYLSGEVSPPPSDNNLSMEKSLYPYQSAGDEV
ncbi:unnamed protein product [Prunus armeniaca]